MREGDGHWISGDCFALVGQLWSITRLQLELGIRASGSIEVPGRNRVLTMDWIDAVRRDLTSLPARRFGSN
jgi:hypothetical protein